MQSARFGLRALRQPALRQNLRLTQRRNVQSAAENPAHVDPPQAQESGFAKLWNSPVGPKTVHFWAPIMKWGIVLAGAADFARPASDLSLSQNMALMCTGAIWTRWCFVIRPKNYFLASVNFLLFCSLKGDSLVDEVKKAAKEQEREIVEVVKHPGKAIENVKQGK